MTTLHETALTERLANYMASALERGLPNEVTEKTGHHVLDTIAAMMSGSLLRPGLAARHFIATLSERGEASVAGSAIRTSAINAAWANGMLAHADETDDSHAPSLSHPGCGVVPAALAVAERVGANGRDFLTAVALGYDIGTRVTQALTIRKFYVEGHKATHAVAAAFGAAAAAAALCRLDEIQMRYVLSYAAQQSSGIASWQRDPDHIEKAFVFGGMPARNGVSAALMVQAGFTGVANVFEGPDNYFEAYSPDGRRDELTAALGQRYAMMHSNIKKWSVGSPVQAPLDAIVAFLESGGDRDQIAAIDVRVGTREAKVVDNRQMPEVCLQHLLAVLLVRRQLTFDMCHNVALMNDPMVLQERSKINLIYDDDLERDLPKRRTIVTFKFKSGESREIRIDAVRGTSDNPMTKQEVSDKAFDLIAPVAGHARARQICDESLALNQVEDMRRFAANLQTGQIP